MSKLNLTRESPDIAKANRSRRSFIRNTGVAISAVVASAAAGVAKTTSDSTGSLNDQIGKLSRRVGNLEDAERVRRLHQSYESHLDAARYEDVAALFADNAEVVYNGGLFRGGEGVRRLYCGHFAAGRAGRKMELAPGFELDPALRQDSIEVAEDRKTAIGRFPYSMQAGTPMTGDSSLVAMARLHGEGIVKWWEGGTCEVSCVKEGETWKIRRLEYRIAQTADYRPGKAQARPIAVQTFQSVFPLNPSGPDALV